MMTRLRWSKESFGLFDNYRNKIDIDDDICKPLRSFFLVTGPWMASNVDRNHQRQPLPLVTHTSILYTQQQFFFCWNHSFNKMNLITKKINYTILFEIRIAIDNHLTHKYTATQYAGLSRSLSTKWTRTRYSSKLCLMFTPNVSQIWSVLGQFYLTEIRSGPDKFCRPIGLKTLGNA